MKKYALACLGLLLVTLSLSAPVARADSSAVGETFSLSLAGMPPSAGAGDVIEGTLSIMLLDSIRPVRREVSYVVSVDTPFGDAVIRTGSFFMTTGNTRTMNISIPIDQRSAPGVYMLRVNVTVAGETLEVDHQMEVGGKR